MTRLLALMALYGCAASAQFYDLATTADGSVVYFSTRHRRAGTDEPFQGRIYAVDSSGLRLFAERARETTFDGALYRTTFYDLAGLDLSADGSLLSFGGIRDCAGGSRCTTDSRVSTTLRDVGSGAERHVDGDVRLSANGRFAAIHPANTLYVPWGVLDLTTGEMHEHRNLPELQGPGRVVTDDGAILLTQGSVELLRLDGTRRVLLEPALERAYGGAIDPAATIAVATTTLTEDSNIRRLRAIDLSDGAARTLVEGVGEIRDLVLTLDGSTALFRSTVCLFDSCDPLLYQVFSIETDGTGLRQLTQNDAGVLSATMSGDGEVAYLVTGRGELIRLDAETLESEALIGRTPAVESSFRSGDIGSATGSLSYVYGAGLANVARGAESAPLPTELAGFRLRLAGYEAPLFSVRPEVAAFQTPWELRGRETLVVPVEIETDAQSVFEPEPILAFINAERPTPLAASAEFPSPGEGEPFTLAATADFSALVTPENPASPGDIVHTYFTGLGAVTQEPPTGYAAPRDEPLARLAEPLSCTSTALQGDERRDFSTPVLYAGLAPGLVGVYQLTVQLPVDLIPSQQAPDVARISCRKLAPGEAARIVLPVRF